jgi:hypothetical protein
MRIGRLTRYSALLAAAVLTWSLAGCTLCSTCYDDTRYFGGSGPQREPGGRAGSLFSSQLSSADEAYYDAQHADP